MRLLEKIFGKPELPKRRVRGSSVAVAIRNEQIIADYATGISVGDLCEKYNLSKPQVYSITRSFQRPRPTSERDQKFEEEYSNGKTATQLGLEHGISSERVCQVLRKSNTIAKAAERKRIARETIEQEAEQIRAAAKAEFAAKQAEVIELVRSGMSIISAARQVGITSGHQMNLLGKACKAAGVAVAHGRWQDFGPKIARVRELRAESKTWSEIDRICQSEGLGGVYPAWVGRHTPEFVTARAPRRPNLGQPMPAREPSSPRPPRAPRPDPDSVWSAERIDQLRELWFKGTTAQQCADILGPEFTRNSIIGKINRLRKAGELSAPGALTPPQASKGGE